ncbi:hypothetical protein CBR_g80133, partial [Chara braunii]
YHLHLSTKKRYASDMYFESGNKGTLSFWEIDETRFSKAEEVKCGLFFDTKDSWGFHRSRTQLRCLNCQAVIGYTSNDGPEVSPSPGVYGLGPSQATPRRSRYRVKLRAIIPDSEPIKGSFG